MPFYYFIGVIWAILVISTRVTGRQRGLESTLVIAIQGVITLLALAGLVPWAELGIRHTSRCS